MADFKTAWAISKINEGGLANNPNDPGGLTYEGISFKFWPEWEGWNLVRAHLTDISTVKDQLEPLVQAFYQRWFWSVISGDFITDQAIANQLFDSALNAGISGSIKWLQKACNLLLPDAQAIDVDGIVGKVTIATIDECIASYQHFLLNTFRVQRGAHYISLVDGNPKMKEFYKSWISRLG